MAEDENELINLRHDLDNHEAELDRLSKRIEQLQEDLKIVVRFALGNIVDQAASEANKSNPSEYSGARIPDPNLQEKYRKFVERYGSQT